MDAVVAPVEWSAPPASASPGTERHRWVLRIGIALLAAVYLSASGISALTGIQVTDLDVFFFPSALYVLHGQPLHIYALRYDTSYPTANGPVSIMLLAAVAALAQHLGWLNDLTLRRMLVMTAFSIFPLLMSWEAVAAVDRLRGSPLRGVWRLLAFGLFATAPGIWHAMLLYGHIEEPIALWLTLLAIRLLAERRFAWAGVSMGLALLTRTSILVFCIMLVIVLVGRRRWRPATWFIGATGLTAGLGILPFVLADARDVLYSLVTFRGGLNIGGGSLWYLVLGTPLESLGTRYDSWFILGGAALIAVLMLALLPNLDVTSRDLYAVLLLGGLCFPLLIKTTWPYYFFDLYVLACVWWVGDSHGWNTLVRWLGFLLPAVVLVCEGIADFGTGLQLDNTAMHTESLAISVIELGMLVAFVCYLVVRQHSRTPRGAPVTDQPSVRYT